MAFKHILKRLVRTPLFTALTVLTLAIGIGANTAIFSVVEGILLRPLPFHNSDELVAVARGWGGGREEAGASRGGGGRVCVFFFFLPVGEGENVFQEHRVVDDRHG